MVAVCGAFAASLLGSGLSGVRPRFVCAAATVPDNSTAATVAPRFALAMMCPLKQKTGRCETAPTRLYFRQMPRRGELYWQGSPSTPMELTRSIWLLELPAALLVPTTSIRLFRYFI